MELTEIILAQAVSLDLTFVASLPNIDRQLVPNSCYTFNARHLAWWMVEYPLSHPFLHDDDLVAYQADPRETFRAHNNGAYMRCCRTPAQLAV